MPRSNKPICTKNPTNPRNFANPKIKLANLKIPPTKHKKKKKKKTQTEIWLTKTQKEKKKKPNPTDCGSVTGEGWFMVVVEILVTDESFNLLVRCFIAWLWLGLLARIFLDLVFWAWLWLWWLGWVASCVVLDRLREDFRGAWSLELRLESKSWVRVRLESESWVRVRCERGSYWIREWELEWVRVSVRCKGIYIYI